MSFIQPTNDIIAKKGGHVKGAREKMAGFLDLFTIGEYAGPSGKT